MKSAAAQKRHVRLPTLLSYYDKGKIRVAKLVGLHAKYDEPNSSCTIYNKHILMLICAQECFWCISIGVVQRVFRFYKDCIDNMRRIEAYSPVLSKWSSKIKINPLLYYQN